MIWYDISSNEAVNKFVFILSGLLRSKFLKVWIFSSYDIQDIFANDEWLKLTLIWDFSVDKRAILFFGVFGTRRRRRRRRRCRRRRRRSSRLFQHHQFQWRSFSWYQNFYAVYFSGEISHRQLARRTKSHARLPDSYPVFGKKSFRRSFMIKRRQNRGMPSCAVMSDRHTLLQLSSEAMMEVFCG